MEELKSYDKLNKKNDNKNKQFLMGRLSPIFKSNLY